MNKQRSFICYFYTVKCNEFLYEVSMQTFKPEIFVTKYTNTLKTVR